MPFDFPNTPSVGQIVAGPAGSYVFDGVKWMPSAQGAQVSASLQNAGRNYVHNGLFNIQQRGVGPWTSVPAQFIYGPDRWHVDNGGGSDSFSFRMTAAADADRTAIGDEAARQLLALTVTGGSAAGNYCLLMHGIEGVRRLSGKTVTVSFWAIASVAAYKLGVSIDSIFGTGGSPSAEVDGAGQVAALTTTWQRYSLTFSIPSAAGKTTGTNDDSFSRLNFWLSAGSNFATRAGYTAAQTGFVNLWGVQLEVGGVASPLEKTDPQVELAKCQRFYQVGMTTAAGGVNGATWPISSPWALPVVMRATPTMSYNFTTNTNTSGAQVFADSGAYVRVAANSVAAGSWILAGSFTASADL